MNFEVNWIYIVLGYFALSVPYGYWWMFKTNEVYIRHVFRYFLQFVFLSAFVGWIQIPIEILQWIWVRFVKVKN